MPIITSYDELMQLSVIELRQMYNEIAPSTDLGANALREEMFRREMAEQQDAIYRMTKNMERMTSCMQWMTVAILFLTVVSVVISGLSLSKSFAVQKAVAVQQPERETIK